jgi:O-antigen ligase
MSPAGETRVAALVAAIVPGGLVVWLSLQSGGYPPGVPATLAALLILGLAARLILAPGSVRAPAGAGRVVVLLLAALTGWALASLIWSNAPARAVVGATRDLLYLATFLTLATLPRHTLPVVIRSLLAGTLMVALVALGPRLAPDVFTLSADAGSQRLAWPLSYQNALGMLTGVGLLLALHVTGLAAEPRRWRLAAAGAVPVLVAALYLTQSRGAIGATVLGAIAWLLLARSRWALAGVLVVAVPTALALGVTYAAVDLIAPTPPPTAIGQGHRVALVLIVCVAAAVWLGSRASRAEPWIAGLELPRVGGGVMIGALVLALAVVGVAAGSQISSRFAQLDRAERSVPTGDPRTRLVQFSSSGRLNLWRGAAEVFREQPLLGHGAETFQTSWDRVRRDASESTEAHSLYVETLAELGVIGLVLVIGVLVALGGALAGAPGPRETRAVCLAVLLAWAAHAAVDWDWEMPAVTIGLFALGGAARRPTRPAEQRSPVARLGLATALVVSAALPAMWAVAQARTDTAAAAYERGDCSGAIAHADAALDLTPFRTEDHFIRAACLVRANRGKDALAAAEEGWRWDPDDFRGAYNRGLVAAAVGREGRSDALRAVQLNPKGMYGSWLRFWLDPVRRRPASVVAGLGPLLLAGQPYPPVLKPYATRAPQ